MVFFINYLAMLALKGCQSGVVAFTKVNISDDGGWIRFANGTNASMTRAHRIRPAFLFERSFLFTCNRTAEMLSYRPVGLITREGLVSASR